MSVRLQAEIWTQDLPNKNQDSHPHVDDVP